MRTRTPPRTSSTHARTQRGDQGSGFLASPATTLRTRRFRRVLALGAIALALLLAALWLRLPADARPTLVELLAAAEQWRSSPIAPFVALACFVVGGVVVFPVNLLMAATIVVFGPFAGGAYALLGSVLSAAAVYEIGRLLPSTLARRLLGERGERLRERIVGHGIVAVAIVRIVPVAPYSIVCFMAGAARIHRGDYLIGTALGMLPGVLVYALFVDRARAVILEPHPLAWLLLLAAIVVLLGVALGLHIWRIRRAARSAAQ